MMSFGQISDNEEEMLQMEITPSEMLLSSSLVGSLSHENGKKSLKANKFDKHRVKIARQLQVHDLMMRQDFEMLNSSFFVSARPSGDRCLVISAKGSTEARNS